MLLTLLWCARRSVQHAADSQPEYQLLLAPSSSSVAPQLLPTAREERGQTFPLRLNRQRGTGSARLGVIFKSKSPADECSVNRPACAGARIIQPVMVLALGNDSNLKAL